MGHHQHNIENMDKKLIIVILLNFLITVVETVGGIYAGSLSLLSDALHNLSDGIAVIITYIALKLSIRQNTEVYTFGYRRAEILASLFNASILLVIAAFLFKEAFYRFSHPVNIRGALMVWVAVAGLIANTLSVFLLSKGSKESLNIRSAYLHLLTDALSSIAVVVGGILIIYYGIWWIDPMLTIAIGTYVIKESFKMVTESIGILMQKAPEGIELKKIQKSVEQIPAVENLHHVHLWKVNEKDIHFEGHIELKEDLKMSEVDEVRKAIEKLLNKEFSINHTTLQFEYCGCEDKSIVKNSTQKNRKTL